MGRLVELAVVPPQVEQSRGSASEPDWNLLLSYAGLDPAKWTRVESTWTPLHYADARAAWTGELPDRPGLSLRIEAAAYRGKPVYFELIAPWTRPTRMQEYQPTRGERISQAIGLSILLVLLVGGVTLARRNLNLGRGDRRGANRLAFFTLGVSSLSWLLSAHHVPTFWELGLFLGFLGWSCFLPGWRGRCTSRWSR